MKPALLVSFILFLLLSEIQGIRLDHELNQLLGHGRVNEQKSTLIGSNGADDKVLFSNGRLSVWTRKLITKTPSTTTESGDSKVETATKRHQPTDHGHSEHEISSSSASEHKGATNGQYPDIIDIAGMDYTPARRKPPIHN